MLEPEELEEDPEEDPEEEPEEPEEDPEPEEEPPVLVELGGWLVEDELGAGAL